MFAATQQSEAQNLADLGAAYAAYRGLRQPVVAPDLLAVAFDRPASPGSIGTLVRSADGLAGPA